MKKLGLLFISSFISTSAVLGQSETCDCKTDLDFIVGKIEKMPSFKKQIKGEKEKEFENTYNTLSTKMNQPILIEDCYKMLLEQMLLVNDVHASLKVNTEVLSKEKLENEVKLEEFKSSETFTNHPKTNRDISKLKAELSQKSLDDLEGIYSFGSNEKIGFYYADNKRDLIGVVLDTNLSQWDIGEIRSYVTFVNSNKYNVYYYKAGTRTPELIKSLSFENGRIWSYKKIGNDNNYEFVENDENITAFKQINEDTQYLYFKSFNNRYKAALTAFYKDTKDKLTAKNIIVDLRSNSGGNSKYSDVYLKLLKNRNVYVITNGFTGSNGEQFTLKLLKNKNAKHLGQTTFGVIAYGLNYGYDYSTPSGHFQIIPTDMNFHKYIAYESKGIEPEMALDFNRDWIEQTLEIIEADHK